jgi:peptide-methionine (S)-S-oxide reductase
MFASIRSAKAFALRAFALRAFALQAFALQAFALRAFALQGSTLLCACALAACSAIRAQAPVTLPDPEVDEPVAMSKGQPSAVFAGGCFWGIEAIFDHVKGVREATSGYAGGDAATANYDAVSSGRTGHAEAVRLKYDRSQITYGQLLKIFFSVGLDPTELNRQGPDEGPQYRSVLFVTNAEQKKVAEAYIAQLNQAKVFKRPIVTQVVPLTEYFLAESYHQDFVAKNPTNRYVAMFDLPKLEHLKKQFPQLYKP